MNKAENQYSFFSQLAQRAAGQAGHAFLSFTKTGRQIACATKNIDPARELLADVYDRPDAKWPDQLQKTIDEESGGETLVAIQFVGKPRETPIDEWKIEARFLLEGPGGKRIIAKSYGAEKGRQNFLYEAFGPFINWAAREKIAIARGANGEWSWHSEKSKTQGDVLVQHFALCLHDEADVEKQQISFASMAQLDLTRKLKEEKKKSANRPDRRLAKAAPPAGKASAGDAPNDEIIRLSQLIPPSKMSFALSATERIALAQTVETAKKPGAAESGASVKKHALRGARRV